MKALTLALAAVLLIFSLGSASAAWGQSEPGYVQTSDSYREDLLSQEDLEDLVSPIALYPDPLIAQILPAATFVEQIDQAADFVRRYGPNPRIEDQPWDVSVKAVAHYPDILYMMDENYEWTVALGQAFVSQQQDLMDAIQSLRREARERGNLYSTSEQQVIYDGEVVRIVPASPEYIYVPVYDPTVVYFEPYTPTYPLITFGMGYTIGAWLNRDCNWHERRVYHHGWRGDGWVHRARPHIHDRRRIYTNRRASVIRVDDRVMLHDTRRYREQLRNDSWRFREPRGVTTPGTVVTRPGRPNRDRNTAGSVWTTPGSRTRERGRPASGATSSGRGSTYQRPSGSTVTAPGTRGRTPGATVTRPGSTVTRPGSAVTTPGSSVTPSVVTTPSKTGRDRGMPGSTGRSGSGTGIRGGTGTGEEMRPAGGVWRRQEGGGRGRGTGSEQRSPASGRGRHSGAVTTPTTTQSPSSVAAPASGRDTSSAGRGGSVRRSPSAQSPSRPTIVQQPPSVQPPRPPVVQPPAKIVVPPPSVQPPPSRPSIAVPPSSVVHPAPSIQPAPVVQPPAATVTRPTSPRPDIGHRPAAPPTTTTTPPLSTPVQQREPGGASSGRSHGGGVWRHR